MPIDFANKSSITVNAGAGDDCVVINSSVPATGLGALDIDGGGGADLAVRRQAPPGVALSAIHFARIDINSQDIFVDELYELRLGRAPAPSELALWEGALNGPGGTAAVVNGIEGSSEARTRMVQFWYLRYLGRQVMGAEANGWINLLLQGVSEEQVLAQILGSSEFFNRAGSFFNTGNASENFIRTLYLLLLNRTAATSEVNGC